MARLHPEFLPTLGVLLVVVQATGALLTSPDPFTQLLSVGVGLPVAVALAALSTYGGGFARLGLSPTGRDHWWTGGGFVAAVVLVGVLASDPTGLLATWGALGVGLLAGAWLGYGGGRKRLDFRSRNA